MGRGPERDVGQETDRPGRVPSGQLAGWKRAVKCAPETARRFEKIRVDVCLGLGRLGSNFRLARREILRLVISRANESLPRPATRRRARRVVTRR